MTEWSRDIAAKFKEYNARKKEIHEVMARLAQELEQEEGMGRVKLNDMEDYPMAWVITLNRKTVRVSEREIAERQNETEDVTAAVRGVLAEKFLNDL